LLGDYLEGIVETVRTQDGLGHLQHRTQCAHVIAHRGVKEMGAHGFLTAANGLLYARWQLLAASAGMRSISLKTHENRQSELHIAAPA
jgi:hypothetical protein